MNESSNHPPRVSVIIPAFNVADTIVRALDSVEAQTYRDYEVIVIDDCSTDDTVAVVEAWIKNRRSTQIDTDRETRELQESHHEDGNYRLPRRSLKAKAGIISLDTNSGPAAARNAGINAAQGEWIAFLDADDSWFPWRLEYHVEAMKLCPDAILFCGNEIKRGDPEASIPRFDSGCCVPIELVSFVDQNPVSTTTVTVLKLSIDSVGGFDEQFRGPEDIDLWMRLAAMGKIVRLDVSLAVYTERIGSLCLNPQSFLPEVLRVMEKAFTDGGALSKMSSLKGRAIASKYTAAAWGFLQCGQRPSAVKCLLKSWAVWPRRLKVEESDRLWRVKMMIRILLNRQG